MIERQGNIWSVWGQPNQIVLVTTNNVRGKGGLIMGKGIALEGAKRVPGLPLAMFSFGDKDYHLMIFPGNGIGCLQTKRHWKDKTPLDLLEKSISALRECVLLDNMTTYHLPRPGCGNGGLNWEKDVKHLCEQLPDNCIVWSL